MNQKISSVEAGCKFNPSNGKFISRAEDYENILWKSSIGTYHEKYPFIYIKDAIYNVKEKSDIQIYHIFTEKVNYYLVKYPDYEYYNMHQRHGSFGEVDYIFILKRKIA